MNLSCPNVDHNVPWLDITVNDTPGMDEIEGLGKTSECVIPMEVRRSYLEELEYVVFHVEFVHASEEKLPVGIVDIFHDETVVLTRGVSDDIEERNDIGASGDVSQHLDLLMWVRIANGDEGRDEFAPLA